MKRSIRRVISLGALVALVAVPTMLPALAQSGSAATPTRVQHRQSVLTQVSPTGAFDSAIVVTQLLVSGNGTVEVSLPNQATAGLRNLEGFDRPSVSGSDVTWSIPTSPAGALRRTVADADTSVVPVSMEIVYELDGEVVTPSQLVGRTGFLTVTYTVTNLTAEEREVRYFDGQGRPRTGTVEVAVPMGGTFSTTLDSRFVNVESAQATAIAGDGQGNTVVNGSYTLFAPAGESTQSFAWSAYVTDAIVPAAEITILPVSSRSSQAISSGQGQLEDLITGFKDITNGGLIINSNLLRLSDGAQAAADGAGQLADGLADTAQPGAQKLADGLKAAGDGGAQIAGGAYLVANGVDDLYEQVYGDDQLLENLILARGALQVSLFGPGGYPAGPDLGGGPIYSANITSNSSLAAICGARIPGVVSSVATAAGTIAVIKGNIAALDFTGATDGTAIPTLTGNLTALQAQIDALVALADPLGTPAGAGTIRDIAVDCGAGPLAAPFAPSFITAYAILGGPQALYPVPGVIAPGDRDGAIFKLEAAKSDVRKLKSGAYAVADGATTLAKGIIDTAAPGAAQLADGLKGAADGAGQLAEGVTTIAGGTVALSEAIEGSLVGGTTEAGADLGLRLAQLNASDTRGIDNEGLPYGTVANADVTAVYSFQIAGVGGDAGASSSALALAALAALALAALLGLAVRSRLG